MALFVPSKDQFSDREALKLKARCNTTLDFRERVKTMFPCIASILSKNLVMAGGAVSYALIHTKPPKDFGFDIDLFLVGLDETAAKAKIQSTVHHVWRYW